MSCMSALAPAKGACRAPIRRRGGGREQRLNAFEQFFGTGKKTGQLLGRVTHRDGILRENSKPLHCSQIMLKSQTRRFLLLSILIFAGFLSACTTVKEASIAAVCPAYQVCQQCPAVPTTPPLQPAAKPMAAARWSDIPGWNEDNLGAAWPAFLQSCRALASKPQWPLWRAACEEAKGLAASDSAVLRRFFESRFEPYLLTNPDATTSGLITGYYEPLLRGSRTRTASFAQAVLGVPPDLLTIELADVAPELKNLRLRGRLQGNKVVPYYSRADITSREKDYADRSSVSSA